MLSTAELVLSVLLYLVTEIWRLYRRPDSAHFAGVWWSAVFPLGMYSTATQAPLRRCACLF